MSDDTTGTPVPDQPAASTPEVHGGHIEQPPIEAEPLRSGEVVDNLTGHDELAIERTFGSTIEALAEHSGGMFLRALLFAHLKSTGTPAGDAHKQVMGMRFADVKARFSADDDSDLPGAPAGEAAGG